MTTNVLDLRNGMAASDSRWSTRVGPFFFYVDDTGFDKIIPKNHFVFVFAGDSALIQEWKDWAENLPVNAHLWPDEERFGRSVAVTLTDTSTGNILFEREQIGTAEARFAGSGAGHAYECWMRNFDPIKAVESAMFIDLCSGGEVKFFGFDRKTNVSNCTRIDKLRNKLFDTGYVMRTDGKPVAYPIREAAANDAELTKAVNEIMSGEQNLVAPCDSMYKPWTSDEKRLFGRAIANIVKEL